MKKSILTAFAIACMSGTLPAQVFITEWMYNADGEFIEFTNLGDAPVDMTGWSYSDSGTPAGTVSLSLFGTIASGESVLLAEQDAEVFRTSWGLSGDVKIIGANVVNLGRNDTINLWNASDALVDTLDYGDVDFPGTIRTQGVSGITSLANIGANNVAGWGLSDNGAFWFDGLSVDNITSSFGEIANPGYLNFTVVPEPSTVAMMTLAFGAGTLFHLRRRSRRTDA